MRKHTCLVRLSNKLQKIKINKIIITTTTLKTTTTRSLLLVKVPILPPTMLDILEAPFPFLVGVRSDVFLESCGDLDMRY
jgi:hypothetical protein